MYTGWTQFTVGVPWALLRGSVVSNQFAGLAQVQVMVMAIVLAYVFGMKTAARYDFSRHKVFGVKAYWFSLGAVALPWLAFLLNFGQLLAPTEAKDAFCTAGVYLLATGSGLFFTLLVRSWKAIREAEILRLLAEAPEV